MKNIKKLLLFPSDSIRVAIEKIEKGLVQIALVVDEKNSLLGTVTDGDIRRGILKGIPIEEKVNKIMNNSPVTALISDNSEKVWMMFKQKAVRHIPILDDTGKLIGLEILESRIDPHPNENIVVLMLGGLGLRLRPLTENFPKPLLKVGNKPLLVTIVENFVMQGFHKFFFSVNYKSHMIENFFGDGSKFNAEISYIHEDDFMGTAGSLKLIPKIDLNPIIVMNGDILTKVDYNHLLDFHLVNNSCATMCVRENNLQIPYGVVDLENQKIKSIHEKPVKNFFVNAGIYVLNPEIISFIPEGTKFDMPQLFETLISKNKEVIAFPIREYWMDIGQKDDFNKANYDFFTFFENS
ncbi:MAG: nucleotidyltransferase family protein [Candidatus Magnetomorum sp.]|nr:nucleotidyltransferase family protein [Candidatus Magnetomorum sp.]